MVAAIAKEARKFGRYVLLGHIADGGMASVYLAQLRGDHHFAKWVALKVVRSSHAEDERFERMFLTEARVAAMIEHPNVAQVFDFGRVDGVFYLAMEYLSGETLHALMRRARQAGDPLPLQLGARIISNAAMGLHCAHELRTERGEPAGIIHRDVSPQNIFILHSGQTKLMDFGIAKTNATTGEEDGTAIGELKGKIAYMSPEQLAQRGIDRRSDLFALGIVLWELVTGERLFKRHSQGEIAVAVMHDPIPPPSTIRSDVPPALDRIVTRALERAPERRYQTAEELAEALEEFIASTGIPAGAPQLSALMEQHFPAARAEHSSRLRSAVALLEDSEHLLVSGEHELPGYQTELSRGFGLDSGVSTLGGDRSGRRRIVDDEDDPAIEITTGASVPPSPRSSLGVAIVAAIVIAGGLALAGQVWMRHAGPAVAPGPAVDAPGPAVDAPVAREGQDPATRGEAADEVHGSTDSVERPRSENARGTVAVDEVPEAPADAPEVADPDPQAPRRRARRAPRRAPEAPAPVAEAARPEPAPSPPTRPSGEPTPMTEFE